MVSRGGEASGYGRRPGMAAALNEEVWALRRRTRRRLFRTAVHVQRLDAVGAPDSGLEPDLFGGLPTVDHFATFDHALRVDLLVGGLGRPGAGRAALVVVRSGPLEVTDQDLAWQRAWLMACGIAEMDAGPFYAVTRSGWIDVRDAEPVPVPRDRRKRQASG